MKAVLESDNPTAKHVLWWIKVFGRGLKYITIKYRAGKRMKADTLSRAPVLPAPQVGIGEGEALVSNVTGSSGKSGDAQLLNSLLLTDPRGGSPTRRLIQTISRTSTVTLIVDNQSTTTPGTGHLNHLPRLVPLPQVRRAAICRLKQQPFLFSQTVLKVVTTAEHQQSEPKYTAFLGSQEVLTLCQQSLERLLPANQECRIDGVIKTLYFRILKCSGLIIRGIYAMYGVASVS